MSQCFSTASYRTHTFTVKIIKQPCKTVRFRYKSENRLTHIFGASTSQENPSFFTIETKGCKGRRVKVYVICITNEKPYKRHPYKLEGQDCKDGYFSCEIDIKEEIHIIKFSTLSFYCLRQCDLKKIMKTNEDNNNKKVDFNILRLCVKVIPEDDNIRPVFVVSDPICDNKKIPDLVIYTLSPSEIRVDNNQDIILVCKKVPKDHVRIRFVEIQDGQEVWEGYGKIKDYKQTSIIFTPPEYHNKYITEPVKVFIHLKRKSNDDVSCLHDFLYLPATASPQHLSAVQASRLSFNDSNDIVGVDNSFQNESTLQFTPPVLNMNNNNSHIAGVTNNFQSNSNCFENFVGIGDTSIQQPYPIEDTQNDVSLTADFNSLRELFFSENCQIFEY